MCCKADAKLTAITFTFTLHYSIFIHRALSRRGLSGMIDVANAFYLEMDGGAESIGSSALSLCAKKVAECKNYSACKEMKVKQQWRRNIIFPLI